MDSFVGTMDRNDAEVLGEHPDRVVVGLDSIVLDSGPEVAAVREADSVGEVSPVLQLAGRLAAPGSDGFDVMLEALDLEGGVWAPTRSVDRSAARHHHRPVRGRRPRCGGRRHRRAHPPHPRRQPASSPRHSVEVVGIHPSPFRFNVYLDRSLLAAFGAEGLTNELFVVPAAGSTTDDVERELFDLPGVSSVLPAATSSQIVRDSLEEFTAIFQVAEGFILLLVLLIAYNATSINADERARERATLFAFGLPVRRVMDWRSSRA